MISNKNYTKKYQMISLELFYAYIICKMPRDQYIQKYRITRYSRLELHLLHAKFKNQNSGQFQLK